MSHQVGITFPNSLKEWHLYNPDIIESASSPYMGVLLGRTEIIKHQNQFQKFLKLWKNKLEKLFPLSFIIDSFVSYQSAYQDYSPKNKNYVIYNIKSKDLFFTIQIDSDLAKLLLNQSFGVSEHHSTDLAYSELEQIVFNQFFNDTFMSALIDCNVLTQQANFETEYGKKEKNGLINSSDGYYVFQFVLLFSSYDEPCQVVFSFTKANMDNFFSKLSFNNKFETIKLNNTVQKEMFTKVEVKFGEAHITLGDLQSIQVGDVLLLKKSIGEPVDVTIGDELRFNADCGLHNNTISIKLLNQLNANYAHPDIPVPQLDAEEGDDELMEEFGEKIKAEELTDFISVLDDNSEEDEEEEYDWESL